MRRKTALPELLCPAGSPDALRAALQSGADAVYFGGPDFNARMRAANFTEETMREGIALCHAFGARAYVTLNTLCTDRELDRFLSGAELAWSCGADALIVADLGGADAIRRAFPEFELHASTQMSGHNTAAAEQLAKCGFSRMVLARETPMEDIRSFVEHSPLESEIFVHGALCVSHSGQCLFSSLVGGRSGNRGECAQPCRLPDGKGAYPLSLKDLCLAAHVPELIRLGVDSLKIEGRLKSPEYVRDVTAVWRRLLDEKRGATKEELAVLAGIFSRGGFTDAYFCGGLSSKMLGVRTQSQKEQSREAEPFAGLSRKVPLDVSLIMAAGRPITLTLSVGGRTATATAEPPFQAQNAPMSEEDVKRHLLRFGGTPYEVRDLRLEVESGLMTPVSRLKNLRREALAALGDLPRAPRVPSAASRAACGERNRLPTARFYDPAQIFAGAEQIFSHIYLPLEKFAPPADGVILPPVIFDHEVPKVRELLHQALKRGAKHALVGNLGHLSLAVEAGLIPHGDFRLNVTNETSLARLLELGFTDVLLSPELTLPQIRDIKGAADVIVYGRIPLMLLEKCAGKEVGNCESCAAAKNQYTDRRGEKFPVLRVFGHRNELYNCRPTVMSDKRAELKDAKVLGGHFLFSTETADYAKKVVKAYREGTPLAVTGRRI